MFQLQLIDFIIIFILIGGAIIGYKKGFIKSVVSFIGVIIVLLLAFLLKNPLSEFMYLHFPFMNFGGQFANISLINILIYEAIAFLVLVLIFGFIMKLIIVLTGILERIARLNSILGFLSKILGLLFGFIKTYLIVFAVFFLLHYFVNINPFIEQGVITSKIVYETPVLSSSAKDERITFDEIVELQNKCKTAKGEDMIKCNQESLDIMLKHNVLKPETAKKLVDSNKLKIKDANEIISKYQTKDA